MPDVQDRCRLVLVMPDIADTGLAMEVLGNALRGGDVASVILPQHGMDDSTFQKHAEQLVPVIQKQDVAALIAGEPRIATRTRADGVHIDGDTEMLADAIERFAPGLIVGGGQAMNRHTALEIGELRPDYIFFGRLDGDLRTEAHPKNLELADWWAALVEIPCVVMGGRGSESAVAVAACGAEFVALHEAVFGEPDRCSLAVAEVNALLDQKAPRFKD